MKFANPNFLYAITDRRLSGLSHAEQTRLLIAGGATLIQIREKTAPARDFFDDAHEALRIARENGATLIINDRVDVAIALGADGVHLGQEDLPPAAARRILGPDKIIGLSTHSVEQALEAVRLPVDYVAIGPVFATGTKENPDAVVGTEGVAAVRAAIADFPLVAIGGIGFDNSADVLASGADYLAVVSALISGGTDIPARVERFLLQNSVS